MKYKQIVFDIDGTLLETEYAVLHSLQDTVKIMTGRDVKVEDLYFALGITGYDALVRLEIVDTNSALDIWDKNMRQYIDSVKVFEGMIDENKIFVVENCVDDQYLLTDQEVEEKLKALESEKVLHVLWLSNFIRSKGYPFVLEMARAEKERADAGGEKRFHFDFAGKFFQDSEKDYFESYIKENGLEEYVTYHGIVGGEHKRELLKKCYIFALLTRYPNEGQPISILEAMGNGMFIITTDHAGIPDIVEDGVNGIVMKNKEESSALVERLLEVNVNQLESIIKNNREHCINRFSEKNYIQNMGKVLRG